MHRYYEMSEVITTSASVHNLALVSVPLMDVDVGGQNVCVCVAPLVHQWAGTCGWVNQSEGWRAGSFSFYIFEVSKLSGCNDFITAVRDGGGLYVERWRCVCVCGVEGAGSI